MARWIPSLAALAVAVAACSEAEPTGLPLPETGTEVVLAGLAPSGGAVDPRFVTVLRPGAGDRLEVVDLGASALDAFAGGLADADLPEGLSAAELPLVATPAGGARALPPLRRPHVIARPGPPEMLSSFVPVDATTATEEERLARADRLRVLLAGTFVQPPCVGDARAVRVVTPRTPAERFASARASPDGTVRLGLVATGTAALAAFVPGDEAPTLEGIDVPSELELSARRIGVRDFGPPGPGGRPSYVILTVEGAFDRAGILLRRRSGRFVDDTPLTPDAPVRSLRGVADGLRLDGTPSTCAFGGVRGPLRDAGLWCRAETSTVWSTELVVREAQSITSLHDAGGGRLVASDRAGALHLRDGGWRIISEARVNQGCRPACAPFDLAPAPAGRPPFPWGGDEAQLFALDPTRFLDGPTALARPVEDLRRRTFVDERPEGASALLFSSAARSPDDRWWLGTAEGVLFRAEPDLERMARVCLPAEVSGAPIGAMTAAQDGRLVFGVGTGRVAFARWDL